jgi:hypothetical protein
MEKMNELKEKPRERVIMARVANRQEHSERSFDMEFWQRVGDAGIVAAAWQMIKEVQLMRGQSGELPPFQKSVARVIRRSQLRKPSELPNDSV